MVKHSKKYKHRNRHSIPTVKVKTIVFDDGETPLEIMQNLDGLLKELVELDEVKDKEDKNLEKMANEINKKTKNDLKNGRQMLFDSPIKVEKDNVAQEDCNCNSLGLKPCVSDDISSIIPSNAIVARDLKNGYEKLTSRVAKNILETIFNKVINADKKLNNLITIDLLKESSEDLKLLNFDAEDTFGMFDKVMSVLNNYGYIAELDLEVNSDKNKSKATLVIGW